MKYQELYQAGRLALEHADIEEAELDARLLLEFVCSTSRNELLVHGTREVEDEKKAAYDRMILQRASRIPLQHITGIQEFMGLCFQVNEHVLIPRQDTEILVEEVLKELHDGMDILDMCTGSGCILVSLLRYSNDCRGTGADISKEALKVAARNGKVILDRPDQENNIQWVHSDLFSSIQGTFDIIVSNPPYIRTKVIQELMPEVREHEPLNALDGLEDGLFFYRRIVAESRNYLKRGGQLFFEIGYDQAEEVCTMLKAAGFVQVEVTRDYAGLDRVVHGILMSDCALSTEDNGS